MKICIIGCGLRTPLLLHGIAHSSLSGAEVALYDNAIGRSELMTALGTEVARGTPLRVSGYQTLADAVQGSDFVISSIRPGEMRERARDERIALECGFAGQETTGPAGFAMAMRTVPVAIEQARLVERIAPNAWIVNFTNPAGLITQAISTHTDAKVIGICDTPAELFFRISLALRKPLEEVECDYIGLNHLGWVDAVRVRPPGAPAELVTDQLFNDDGLLRSLYSADLFPPELIRGLKLIPTEYLYFYYNHRTARENQLRVGATRASELLAMNDGVFRDMESHLNRGNAQAAVAAYRAYLNRRNSSYMRLEGEGKSALDEEEVNWDPFAGATGYHRIAVDVMKALCASDSSRIVLNIRNGNAVTDLSPEDVVEVPCMIDRTGPRPVCSRALPELARALTLAVKEYERLTIQAAISRGRADARLALFSNPSVADWNAAGNCVDQLLSSDAFIESNRSTY